jgi:DNA-directed RNA polymerase specialized sigma24 family protein
MPETILVSPQGDLPLRVEWRGRNMPSDLKTDLLALIPSLRAFAFSLTQNLSDADDLVHSALIEIWSRQAANRDQNLRGAAFAAVHGRFMQMNLVSQLAMAASDARDSRCQTTPSPDLQAPAPTRAGGDFIGCGVWIRF